MMEFVRTHIDEIIFASIVGPPILLAFLLAFLYCWTW